MQGDTSATSAAAAGDAKLGVRATGVSSEVWTRSSGSGVAAAAATSCALAAAEPIASAGGSANGSCSASENESAGGVGNVCGTGARCERRLHISNIPFRFQEKELEALCRVRDHYLSN